ncbi:hypothetical protein EDC94DRAFT_676912 [Helicostylum pulchrum]|nr:hypothetical protein EDC94DRAFT_676912 [Helicostylum pulchrum]
MRFISSALAVFAFALSANAVSSEYQGLSVSVTVCNNRIKTMTKELPVIIELLTSFTSADGIDGGLKIYNVADPIFQLMETARKECCADVEDITVEDAQSVVDTVRPVIAQVVKALDITSQKKGDFDRLIIATEIAQDMIKGFYSGTKAMATCISDAGSAHQPSFIPVINDLVSQIDNAFLNAKKVYGF